MSVVFYLGIADYTEVEILWSDAHLETNQDKVSCYHDLLTLMCLTVLHIDPKRHGFFVGMFEI